MSRNLLDSPGAADMALLLPELALMLFGCLVLLWEMARPKDKVWPGWVTILGHVVALGCLVPGFNLLGKTPFLPDEASAVVKFHGNLVADGFGLTMKGVVLVGSMLATLLALRYSERFKNPGEFFAMLLFASSAAVLLCGASDLLMIYLAVEFLSLASYVLVGYLKFQPRSTEAALKYFLYGAITAAVMLYGMSLVYGMAGSTNLYTVPGEENRPAVGGALAQLALQYEQAGGVVLVALGLIAVGLGFKSGMAPFHQWVPDVYDGAPLPVMAWLSVSSKAAAMAVFVRVLWVVFPHDQWFLPVAVLSAITMTVGNLAALPQTNVKRMLAYSSIAHAGYALMAVAALGAGQFNPSVLLGPDAVQMKPTVQATASVWQHAGLPVYLATYIFMNLGALAVVMAVYQKTKSHSINDYAGLAQRAPGLAWLMLFFLLSLAGIPPTAGFWGKFVLFAATLEAGPHLVWLAICGFLNSVVSVYYYWNVVRAMFIMKPVSQEAMGPTADVRLTLAVAAVGTIAIFVLAGPFMTLFNVQ